jgi:hypothetical protein
MMLKILGGRFSLVRSSTHLIAATLFLILVCMSQRAFAQDGLEGIWAKKEFTLDPWGSIAVADTFKFRNIGNSSISSVRVLVPKDAIGIQARDDIGSLSFSITELNDSKVVQVNFRYVLRGRTEEISYQDRATVSILYSVSFANRVTQLGFGRLQLIGNLTTGLELPVSEWVIQINLPEGAVVEDFSPFGLEVGSSSISCRLTGVPANFAFIISVKYSYSPIWSAMRPTLAAGLCFCVVGLIAIMRRIRPAVVKQARESSTELKAFIDSLEDELAIQSELDDLERGLDSRSITRKEYYRRKRILENRAKVLAGTLASIKQHVRNLDPQYVDIVNKIDAAESELALLREDAARLRNQYRAGKLSRSVFEKLEAGSRKRLEHAWAEMERLLAELRGEVR